MRERTADDCSRCVLASVGSTDSGISAVKSPGRCAMPAPRMVHAPAEPGYNTTCPKGGMQHRITPSYQTVNETLERAIPPMDQQIADQAVKTLATLASRSTPWFCAGEHDRL